jgi:hypothetical protein
MTVAMQRSEHPSEGHEVSRLLAAWSEHDATARNALVPIVYRELRRLGAPLHAERAGLKPTNTACPVSSRRGATTGEHRVPPPANEDQEAPHLAVGARQCLGGSEGECPRPVPEIVPAISQNRASGANSSQVGRSRK